MTNRTVEAAEIAKLAERVEAATGANYSLEVAIFKVIHPEYADYVEGRGGLVHPQDGSDMRVLSDVRPRNYTASIDAAMSLIPELDEAHGERFRLEAYVTNGVLAEHVRASAWVPGAPRAYAATPALALTAAALRARATLSERSESE